MDCWKLAHPSYQLFSSTYTNYVSLTILTIQGYWLWVRNIWISELLDLNCIKQAYRCFLIRWIQNNLWLYWRKDYYRKPNSHSNKKNVETIKKKGTLIIWLVISLHISWLRTYSKTRNVSGYTSLFILIFFRSIIIHWQL